MSKDNKSFSPNPYTRIFEHTFRNGNRVEVTESGVTLWDGVAKRWVIDASDLVADNEMRIAQTKYKRHRPPIASPTLYPERKIPAGHVKP